MKRCVVRAVLALAALVVVAATQPALAQNEMFVTNFANNSVTVYPRAANGNVGWIRKLVGGTTGLNGPAGLAVDTVNNEIYVANANNNSITVYPLGADGNIAPTRTIIGGSTGLNGVWGIFLDSVHNELFVANNFSPGTITVYAAAHTADGDRAPDRTLSGAATALNSPINVAVDTVNNEMVVANATGTVGLSITVYPRTADGDVAFLRNIHGAATGLDNPVGVAVDTVHGTIVESNFTPSVSTFPRLADNNASPLRSIAGGATGLSQTAGGVAVDTANDEIFVVNTNNNSITVYPRLADGNALPQRTVAGLLTGLAQPSFVAITTPLLPPVLQNAVSRKVHGGVATFDLTLSAVPTNPTTEPRQGPAQTIAFTFDKPINAAIVTITEGVATALAPIFSGNSVIVGLAGVTDRQYVTVSLTNVASTDGATGGLGSVRLGFLVGDVNQNRVVTLADLGLVNAQLTLPVSAANFLKDVNANGTLTLADKGITNANLTRALPPP